MDERKKKLPAIPTRIVVREEINKGEDREYQTFLNQQGCQFLEFYLKDRMTPKPHRVYDKKGRPVLDKNGKQKEELRAEKLTDDSPIVAHNHPYRLQYEKAGKINYYTESFVPAQNISYAIISPVFKKLGLKQPSGDDNRPYVLRSYFDNRLMSAESDKKIGVIYSWRQYWMGHVEGIEAVYTTNKGIPKDVIEQMRKAYAQASDQYLTPPKTALVSADEAIAKLRRDILSGIMTEEEIGNLGDLSQYTMRQIMDMTGNKLQPKQTVPKPSAEIIEVPREQVVKKMNEGYVIVEKLDDRSFAMEPKST